MKNIHTILSELGITVPEDKKAGLDKAVAENYKTTAEHEKKVNRLTEDLNAEKQRADTAEETLKGFEGIDPAKVNEEISSWKKKAEEAQQNAQKQLEERDFNDALKTELESIQFTSGAAKKAVEAEIRAAGLKLKNGKILGLSDMIDQLRKDDASAFADDKNPPPARFTAPGGNNGNNGGGTITKNDIMKIKDPVERQRMIGQNLNLFGKEK